jgi:hypothetical protein
MIDLGEFRGETLHGSEDYDQFTYFPQGGQGVLRVPALPDGSPDVEGPITCGPYHPSLRSEISPEEAKALRPLFRRLPEIHAAYREERLRREAALPARSREQAEADRAVNLARHGLSDSPTDAASMTEAERTPLAPAAERNPGGRCPECGHTPGPPLDCCFA